MGMSNFMLREAAGDVGHQIGDVRRVVVVGALERLLGDVLELETLLFDHAPDDAPLAIHHRIGVGEVARHLDPGTLDLADALAEIAAFGQRDILRAALGLPQILALEFEQFGGIAFFHFGAEFLELRVGVLGLRRDGHGPGNGTGPSPARCFCSSSLLLGWCYRSSRSWCRFGECSANAQSGNGRFVGALVPFVVHPVHHDLVTGLGALHLEAEDRVARDRGAGLAVDHALAADIDGDGLNEMGRARCCRRRPCAGRSPSRGS
jgi:hypothetical protein